MDNTGLALAEIATNWREYQAGMVRALTPLSPEQLALRPAPDMWSVGTIASHIVAVRVGWFHGWMGAGPAELDALADWDDEPEPHSAADIVSNLTLTWSLVQSGLSLWTAEDLEKSYNSPYRKDRPARTGKWIVWHVIEHDIHHGGEISLLLGMNGVPTMDV